MKKFIEIELRLLKELISDSKKSIGRNTEKIRTLDVQVEQHIESTQEFRKILREGLNKTIELHESDRLRALKKANRKQAKVMKTLEENIQKFLAQNSAAAPL